VEPFYQRPVGFDHRAASGIQAQRYLAESGLKQTDLARVAAHRWSAAARTRKVQVDAAPSADDVMSSPDVALPLKELMMARPVDGAVAVLLASEDIARRCARSPVWITGMGASSDRHSFAVRKPGTLEACREAARSALSRSGLAIEGVSVAETSASSAASELMVLEALGLAKAGRGIQLIDRQGNTAINLSGGSLPADPVMATGLVRLAEGARQLAFPSEYGLRAPSSAIVHGSGGVGMQSHCVLTLEV
jgi:acetyl-CoA C-acetyltransferase